MGDLEADEVDAENAHLLNVLETDQQLLTRFQSHRDHDAFAALVQRHHGMLFGIAHRMLGCPHTAEDVVQATFLVLAKDARKIRKRGSLASWLYGIAYRISARSAKQRARAAVLDLKDNVMTNADPLEQICAQSEQHAVLEELYRLPENTRTPMVLRYLQEQSNSDVAEAMNLSESAVEGRLKRGKHQLRMRLARQGIAFTFVLSVLESIRNEAGASAWPQLVEKTVETCLTGTGTQLGSLQGEPFQLAQQELAKMVTTKVMHGVFVASLVVGIGAAGLGLTGNANLFAQDDDPFGSSGSTELIAEAEATSSRDDNVFGVAPPARDNSIDEDVLDRFRDENDGGRTPNDNPFEDSSPRKKSIAERMRALGEYGIADDTEAFVRILEAMRQPSRLEFEESPLEEAAMVISEQHDIPIMFDKLALEDANIDPSNDPVSINVSNIKLENALQLLLDELDLTTVIRNEVLMVTSKTKAEEELATRTYRIAPQWKVSEKELADVITTMADPDSWIEVGGPGAIQSIEGGVVVSNSQLTHRKISKVLAQLDQLYEQKPQHAASGRN